MPHIRVRYVVIRYSLLDLSEHLRVVVARNVPKSRFPISSLLRMEGNRPQAAAAVDDGHRPLSRTTLTAAGATGCGKSPLDVPLPMGISTRLPLLARKKLANPIDQLPNLFTGIFATPLEYVI